MQKHAFTIVWALLAAMILAALVRLALSPELMQAPVFAGSPRLTQGLVLLGLPAFLALWVLGSQLSLRWMRGTPEAVQAWRDYWGVFHLIFVLFAVVCQTVGIFKSLGMLAPLWPGLGLRGFSIFIGLVLMVMFNRLPKLPPIQSVPSASRPPDPVVWARMARLNSSVVVGLGLMMVVAGLVGPTPQTAPFLSALLTAFFVVALLAYVYCFWRWHWAGTRR